MSPKMLPKSFGTFEKRAPGHKCDDDDNDDDIGIDNNNYYCDISLRNLSAQIMLSAFDCHQ